MLGLLACNQDEEVEYVQFNADNDTIEIEIGTTDLLPDRQETLHSSTGQVEIGLIDVSPGGGPVGTQHEMVVIVDDEYQDIVDRVSVRIESPGRGEDEYDLVQDSADEGYYQISLESQGADEEVRTDVLTVRLWEIEATEETSSEEGTEETER